VVDSPEEVRAAIGVTGQLSALDELLTGTDNMRLMADLNHLGRSGHARSDELLGRFGLVRSAVLTGHVVASLVQTLVSLAVVIGFAIALGFRPTANLLSWLAAIGVLVLLTFALVWLARRSGWPPRA
jgi:hypothetical protein